MRGLPPAQARALTSAAQQASLHGFHLGMLIAAVLVAIGGLVGAAEIRNRHGAITAEHCPTGQLVGPGRQLAEAGVHDVAELTPRSAAVERALAPQCCAHGSA